MKSIKWLHRFLLIAPYPLAGIFFILNFPILIAFALLLFGLIYLIFIASITLISDYRTVRLIKENFSQENSIKDNIAGNVHLIILAKSDRFLKRLGLYSGVDLLIEKLRENQQPFEIFEVLTPESAGKKICNPKYGYVYIFGHGTKGSLKFYLNSQLPKKEPIILNYQTLSNCQKKKYVAQFHCNRNMNEKSLIEILVKDNLKADSFLINGIRLGFGEAFLDIWLFTDIKKISTLN